MHQVVTILNAEGARHLQQSLWFDKFYKIDDVSIIVYNSAGLPVKHYKKKDFAVASYYDGMSLATDDKIMRLAIAAPEYPCTIDVRYVRNASGYINLPNWYMNNAASGVERFRYEVKVPAHLDIRYKGVNVTSQPHITNKEGQKTYTWEIENVPAQKIEADGYEAAAYLPQIKIAPNTFEYDGYKGDFTTWNAFGKWCYALYDDKDPFTEQRAAEIKSLVAHLPDVNSKIAALYGYMQKNMRYVSIQFGIGGYKPFAVRFVDEKKYGDCKALTNYMRNLLSVAGIKAYPALINSGFNEVPVSPAFPENVFNHVILCVPHGKDSIWLECTSTANDVNVIGSNNENKNALLLTEAGGFLVKTPESDFTKNTITTVAEVFIDSDGSATGKSRLHSSGSFYNLLHAISSQESNYYNELFGRHLNYKPSDAFSLNQDAANGSKKAWNLTTAYAKFFDFRAGNKFFFPLATHLLCDEAAGKVTARKTTYVFPFPYTKTDTTVFHLPPGFSVSSLPKSRALNLLLVRYSSEITYDETANTIRVIRELAVKHNIIPADEYTRFSETLAEIKKQEEAKFILLKK